MAIDMKTIQHPELTGTPKQIAWATKIRTDFDREFEIQSMHPAGLEMLERVYAHTESAWWIENRGELVQGLMLKTSRGE